MKRTQLLGFCAVPGRSRLDLVAVKVEAVGDRAKGTLDLHRQIQFPAVVGLERGSVCTCFAGDVV